MKKVTTVCGDIAPEELGYVSMHEHMLTRFDAFDAVASMVPPIPDDRRVIKGENMEFLRSAGILYNREMYTFSDASYLAYELNAFKKLGGGSVFDGSATDIRGDIRGIKWASEATGVNIICSTGVYRAGSTTPYYLNMTEQEQYEMSKREIEEGIDGTDIKAGAVKAAMGELGPDGEVCEVETRSIKVGARIAAEYDLAFEVHTSYPTIPPDVVYKTTKKIIDEYGMPADKLIILHQDTYSYFTDHVAPADDDAISDADDATAAVMGFSSGQDAGGLHSLLASEYVKELDVPRNVYFDAALRLLDLGVNIGIDGWGMRMSQWPCVLFDDFDRLKMMYHLLKRGYAGQITTGHDMIGHCGGTQDGGYGMTRFADFALPKLKELGISDETLHTLTVDTPARLLAHE